MNIDKMREDDWIDKVKGILKAELSRKNVSYKKLALKLNAIGVEETAENINNKINRGKFSAVFLIQCLSVIGITNIDI